MPEPLLKTDSVSLAYFDGDRTTYAVREISVEIPDRQFVGVMGPSGSGKSSLLYLLSGLKLPTSGDVYLGDRRISAMSDSHRAGLRRRAFGFVFQQPWLLSWQTALENVVMGAPQLGREAIALAERYFEELGIKGMERKMPSQLSGGEKQRVCVARAMMNNPSVIFADEPTASLDHANGHLVVDLLCRYRERGTVIIVTHDAEMLAGADRVLVMRDGREVDWVSPRDAAGGQGFALREPASS